MGLMGCSAFYFPSQRLRLRYLRSNSALQYREDVISHSIPGASKPKTRQGRFCKAQPRQHHFVRRHQTILFEFTLLRFNLGSLRVNVPISEWALTGGGRIEP